MKKHDCDVQCVGNQMVHSILDSGGEYILSFEFSHCTSPTFQSADLDRVFFQEMCKRKKDWPGALPREGFSHIEGRLISWSP